MRGALALVLFLSACSHNAHVEPGEPKGEAKAETHDASPSVVEPALQQGAGKPQTPDATAVTPAQPPAKIHIVVHSSPTKTLVSWGKKKLGFTPLTIERPRDSGPVDLVLRNSGYFPVHTRAYTVKNDAISVKMVKLADRMTIYGARQEIVDTPTDPLDPANALPPPTTTPPTTAPLPGPAPFR